MQEPVLLHNIPMNMLDWLKHYPLGQPVEWLSLEKSGLGIPSIPASNSELRRWCNTALIMNGEHVTWDEELDFPIISAQLFTNKRKITLI